MYLCLDGSSKLAERDIILYRFNLLCISLLDGFLFPFSKQTSAMCVRPSRQRTEFIV